MTDVVNSSTIGGDRAVVPVTTPDGHGALAQAVVLVDPTGVYVPAGTATTLSDTIWTDDTNAYFVRRDNGTAITWTTVAGVASAAPGTGARPASGLTAVIDRASYAANTNGTGFSTGDLIDHIVISDPGSGVVIGNFWINSTTSAKITAPSAGALSSMTQPVSAATLPLPTGAATQATLADVLAKLTADPATQTTLAAILTALGATILVGGVVADGNAPTSNAVRVSGVDDGGLKRTFLTDAGGRLAGCIPYNDTATPLAGAATFTGTARDSGAVSAGASGLGYFNAFFFADQAGTGSIEGSWDNATWTKLASSAVAVSTPLTLQVPLMFRYHRAKLVNGATIQTLLQIASSYTAS